MSKSLIEELPRIAREGRREAERALERMVAGNRVSLQTNEMVLPCKDESGLWRGMNPQEMESGKYNRLIYGDNLLSMQALLAGDESSGLESLRGKVNLIYIDAFRQQGGLSHKNKPASQSNYTEAHHL